MINGIKTFTTDKICDVYLRHLYKSVAKGKETEFLNNILDNKRIYYDQQIIDEVAKKLLEKNLIIEIPGKSIFSYGKRRPMRGKKKKLTFDEVMAPDIENLEGVSNLYKLTKSGFNFIHNDQFFDEKGKQIEKTKIDKWIDRLISFLISVATTLVTYWLIN